MAISALAQSHYAIFL